MNPKFKDMAKSPEEMKESMDCQMPGMNLYPYGLCISLDQESLEKLELVDELQIGDMIHLFCLAEVTSISKNTTDKGEQNRAELQIKFMAADEEDEENEEAEAHMPHFSASKMASKMYNSEE